MKAMHFHTDVCQDDYGRPVTSPENPPTTALELNHRLSTLVDRYIDWFQALTVQPDSMIDRANRRMKYARTRRPWNCLS
ncbi:hypothetical protein ABH922_005734 [Rhodococcus sp. 27YEA15]